MVSKKIFVITNDAGGLTLKGLTQKSSEVAVIHELPLRQISFLTQFCVSPILSEAMPLANEKLLEREQRLPLREEKALRWRDLDPNHDGATYRGLLLLPIF